MRKPILVLILAVALGSLAGGAPRSDVHGRATATPAYYDAELFTVLHKDFKEKPAEALLEHNKNVNVIYVSPGFIDVIDAIPGDGFNGIWQEVGILFNPGHPPHQFTGDEDIDFAATSGEITLIPTDEVEICAVVGPKN